MKLVAGQSLRIVSRASVPTTEGTVGTIYEDLCKDLRPGNRVLLSDGEVGQGETWQGLGEGGWPQCGGRVCVSAWFDHPHPLACIAGNQASWSWWWRR